MGRRLGLAATGLLTLSGPALVLGLVPFRVQMPIALGAFGGLSGWILLSSRAPRGTLPDEVTRLGVLSGGGVLASGVVTGGALLLPRASVLRRATLAVGAAPVVLGMLAVRVVPASRPGAGDRRVEPMAVPSLPGLGVARQGPPEGSRRRRLGPLEDRARCAADRPCV